MKSTYRNSIGFRIEVADSRATSNRREILFPHTELEQHDFGARAPGERCLLIVATASGKAHRALRAHFGLAKRDNRCGLFQSRSIRLTANVNAAAGTSRYIISA